LAARLPLLDLPWFRWRGGRKDWLRAIARSCFCFKNGEARASFWAKYTNEASQKKIHFSCTALASVYESTTEAWIDAKVSRLFSSTPYLSSPASFWAYRLSKPYDYVIQKSTLVKSDLHGIRVENCSVEYCNMISHPSTLRKLPPELREMIFQVSEAWFLTEGCETAAQIHKWTNELSHNADILQ
jgi:hypothetical protein